MDPRLTEHYEQELRFIREMGTEFAKRYPKIAGRLDLGNIECADPYVERLLEGFAFLTARVQLKMEDEFPRFTQHLLEMLYPHYLAPTPSMAIVEFQADLNGGLSEVGYVVPKNTELRGNTGKKGRAHCEFRTAHEVTLWPIKLKEVDYLPLAEALRYTDAKHKNVKSAIRFRLEACSGYTFQEMNITSLPLFIKGGGDFSTQILELLMANSVAVVTQYNEGQNAIRKNMHRRHIQQMGFDDEHALLPYDSRSFKGYRYLQEYFSLPERFLFVSFSGLGETVSQCNSNQLEIVVLLDHSEPKMEDLLDTDAFALHCTPVINLFKKRADRIRISEKSTEQHLVVDRTRARDFEVFKIQSVTGYGGNEEEQVFRAFYDGNPERIEQPQQAYYTFERQVALKPLKERYTTTRSPYLGSEVFITLVDMNDAPYSHHLKELGVEVLCSNRDLPQYLMMGHSDFDFSPQGGEPVTAIRCLVGPTDPKMIHPVGEYAWRLINHLSLNYLSLLNEDHQQGAQALQTLLRIYSDSSQSSLKKQIDGLINIESESVVRRIPVAGPIVFGRGIQIIITFDEGAFEGIGAFLLGSVLDRFFSKYASINSFVQTVVKARTRGEIIQWPVRTGTRKVL